MLRKILNYPKNAIDQIYNKVLFCVKDINSNSIKINGRLRIYGKGKIIIGDNTKINSSLSSNPIGGQDYSLLVVDSKAVLKIGRNTGLSNTSIVCRTSIVIGNNVLIGGNTKIYDTDFHSINYGERTKNDNDKGQSREIQIKDGAFIGAHCIVLKGVIIGRNSIIGAGSVVSKDIPDNQVWAGNPARFIKSI